MVVVVVFGRGAIGVLLVAQSVVVRETLERWLLTRTCLRLNSRSCPSFSGREMNTTTTPPKHDNTLITALRNHNQHLDRSPYNPDAAALSCGNRRTRSIWQEHSQHIITSAYKTKIPHIEQAISLTLVEARYGEIPFRVQPPELHLYLP